MLTCDPRRVLTRLLRQCLRAGSDGRQARPGLSLPPLPAHPPHGPRPSSLPHVPRRFPSPSPHLTSPHLTHPLFLHCIHLYPPSCLHDRVYSIHLLLLNTDKSNRRNTPDAACLPWQAIPNVDPSTRHGPRPRRPHLHPMLGRFLGIF